MKPFSAIELLARVRSNLELERTRRAAARRKHEIAIELQEKLAPNRSPQLPLLDIATYYQPGVSGTQAGGDWFEAIDLGRARTALVVGDVMGKGIPAAATMGQLRSIVCAYAGLRPLTSGPGWRPSTHEYAALIPVRLPRASTRWSIPVRCHLSLPMPVTRPRCSSVAMATPSYDCRPRSGRRWCAPVAVRQGAAQLEPGSMLVLYTDGLVETRAGDIDARIDHVAEIARRWTGPIDDLPTALVQELCPGRPDG